MCKIVIIGAGRLGKGFVGETFNNANWDITFIDQNQQVINALNANREYRVTVHREEEVQERIVKDYNAYTWKDNAVGREIIETDIIAFVIYPEDFKEAIKEVKKHLKIRVKENAKKPLTMICLTNKNGLIPSFYALFEQGLTFEEQQWFHHSVVLRDSIIRRSTDAKDAASLEIRTTAVLSLLIQEPINVDIRNVEWMELTDNLEILKDVKVFIVNGPHVSTAFMGYYKGYETINEAAEDFEVMRLVNMVTKEIRTGIVSNYDLTEEQLDTLSHFPKAKGEMIDYIYRVAFDPQRKLSNNDRLVGSALLCKKAGTSYKNICKAIAYGYKYSHPKDPKAIEIQEYIANFGIQEAIIKYSGLTKQEDITKQIIHEYNAIDFNTKEENNI